MSARVNTPRNLIGVLFLLLILTALTVGVSFLPLSGPQHLASGLSIAGVKASLVALFFMHVIDAPAATRGVILVTVFWLVAVLLALTLSDYATRGSLPLAPGH